MVIELKGKWEQGFALDLHTVSSKFIGEGPNGPIFDTVRTEIGELVYKLKYQNDETAVSKIIQKIKESLSGIDKFDYIVSIPPSNKNRTKQPVLLVCSGLSKIFNVKFIEDLLIKDSTEEIKRISDYESRINILKKNMRINSAYNLINKKILLVDDLYRSGATLNVAAELLYEEAQVNTVCIITLTKTRKNR